MRGVDYILKNVFGFPVPAREYGVVSDGTC